MKLAYTEVLTPEEQLEVEETIAFTLFERTDLDEEDANELARELAIAVTRLLRPEAVVEVIDGGVDVEL